MMGRLSELTTLLDECIGDFALIGSTAAVNGVYRDLKLRRATVRI
jgi:hypothetical protein